MRLRLRCPLLKFSWKFQETAVFHGENFQGEREARAALLLDGVFPSLGRLQRLGKLFSPAANDTTQMVPPH